MAEMDLAIARMLAIGGCKVSVYILEFGHKGTEDFQTNLAKLHLYPSVDIHFIQDENNFHSLAKETVVIDALVWFRINETSWMELPPNLSIISIIAGVQ